MRPIIILVTATILCSCSKPQNASAPVKFSNEADSATAKINKADSTYSVRHGVFDGLHSHGNNAAVHSHQDIPRMRRMGSFNAQQHKIRVDSYKRTTEFQDSLRRVRLDSVKNNTVRINNTN